MFKKLVRVGEGRGIVIDEPILELIGAADAEGLELTTDGRHLLLARIQQPPGRSAPTRSNPATGVGISREQLLKIINELGHEALERVGWTHAIPPGNQPPRSRRIFAFNAGEPVREIHLRGYPASPHPAFTPWRGLFRMRPQEFPSDKIESAVKAALEQLGDPR